MLFRGKILILIVALFASEASFAVDNSQLTGGEKIEKVSTIGKDFLSRYFRTLSAEIDSIFSTRRTSYLTNRSQFRIFYVETARQNETPSGDMHLSFNIVLPQTEQRFRLVFERKPRRLESPENTGDIQPPEAPDNQKKQPQMTASLRYFIVDSERVNLATDTGIQFEAPAQPFTRVRAGYSMFPLNKWELRLGEEVYYFFIDRWRFVTSLDSDHTLTDKILFRIGNEITWNQLTDTYEYLYGPSLFQKISDKRAISYHFKWFAKNIPAWQNTNLELSVVYRQQIIKEWFFYEIIPALDWPRSLDWKLTPSISAKLEMVF